MYLSLTLLFLHLLGNVEISLTQNACSKLPAVLHAQMSEETKKAEYQKGNVILFTCEPGYISDQSPKFICTSLGWFPINQEKCYSCSTLPDIPHADVSAETRKPEYRAGDVIHFTCESGYSSDSAINYVCVSEGWLPVSLGVCSFSGSSCDSPPSGRELKVSGLPENDNLIHPGHILNFVCASDDVLQGSSRLVCGRDGQWSNPFPTCGVAEDCGSPPPLVNGDTVGSHKSNYTHNEKVRYVCQRYYVMDGQDFRTCNNGKWIGEMTCLQPCTVDKASLNEHNITFKYSDIEKMYAAHGDMIEFKCSRGRLVGTLPMRQTCKDGFMQLPSCQ